MNKFKITGGHLAVITAIALIFFSCNVTKSKEAAPSTNTKQTQQSTEQTHQTQQQTQQTPKALTDAEKARQEKITALQNNCTGFSGTYDYGRFSNEKDDTIRFLELKCAQAKGVDLKSIISNGVNLLHSAAAKGDLESVKFLVDTVKINIDSPNPKDRNFTALIYAAENGHLNVVKYLVGKNADTSNFDIYDQAILYGHLDIIKYFIECANVGVNFKSGFGRTMLISAVTNNQLEIVKYLMSKGADATIKDWSTGKTACILASGPNAAEMLKAMNNCTPPPAGTTTPPPAAGTGTITPPPAAGTTPPPSCTP